MDHENNHGLQPFRDPTSSQPPDDGKQLVLNNNYNYWENQRFPRWIWFSSWHQCRNKDMFVSIQTLTGLLRSKQKQESWEHEFYPKMVPFASQTAPLSRLASSITFGYIFQKQTGKQFSDQMSLFLNMMTSYSKTKLIINNKNIIWKSRKAVQLF